MEMTSYESLSLEEMAIKAKLYVLFIIPQCFFVKAATLDRLII